MRLVFLITCKNWFVDWWSNRSINVIPKYLCCTGTTWWAAYVAQAKRSYTWSKNETLPWSGKHTNVIWSKLEWFEDFSIYWCFICTAIIILGRICSTWFHYWWTSTGTYWTRCFCSVSFAVSAFTVIPQYVA